MPTMTIAIPEDLKKKMDAEVTVNWSAVARRAFEQRIRDMEFLETLGKKSDMSIAETVRLGRKVNQELAKRYRKVWKSSGKTK